MTATQVPPRTAKTARDIIDKYSPLAHLGGGVPGRMALKAARPLEWAYNAGQAVLRYPFNFGYENTAGQYVGSCPAIIPATLRRMEKKLQAGFNTAAAAQASRQARMDFLSLADEVESDAAVLSGSFNVVGGVFGVAPEKYTFIVQKQGGGADAKLTTLQQGVDAVRDSLGRQAEAVGNDPFALKRPPGNIPTPLRV